MTNVTEFDIKSSYCTKFVSNLLGGYCQISDLNYCEKIFDRLTLSHEIRTSVRDAFGNFEWNYDDAHLKGRLYDPYLDVPIEVLRQQLQATHPQVKLEPRWPREKKFALCLSHDVDEVTERASWSKISHRLTQTIRAQPGLKKIVEQSVYSIARAYRKLRHLGIDPLWHYEDWLKIEDKYGYKSTFFFFPSELSHPHYYDCAYRMKDRIVYEGSKMSVKDMLQQIDKSGWEIGLHGSYHSAGRLDLLKDQRQQISTALGREIYSTRQHFLRYDPAITPSLHAQAGFTADSTQGYNFSLGFRAGTSFPYGAWDHQNSQPLPLLEIPLNIMDSSLFNPNLYGYNEERAIRHCLKIMDNVERVGGCLTLSWHPNYLNQESWWNVYKILLEEAHHRNAWGCSVSELHQWWTDREKRVMANKIELDPSLDIIRSIDFDVSR
jgi:peptidoglycan/xylan/chitin deacetylase (PgdA/CDA1 family)